MKQAELRRKFDEVVRLYDTGNAPRANDMINEDRDIVRLRNSEGRTLAWYPFTLDSVAILAQNGANFHDRDKAGTTPLMYIVQRGNIAAIACAANMAGLRIDEQDNLGNTALHHAVEADRGASVDTLRALGADISIKNGQGLTPLQFAMLPPESCVNIHASLVRHGHPEDLVDSGAERALFLAARYGWRNGTSNLVSRGVSPDVLESHGRTPLMVAALHGGSMAVDWLLSAGLGDLKATDHDGKTALDLALEGDNAHTIALVRQEAIERRRAAAGDCDTLAEAVTAGLGVVKRTWKRGVRDVVNGTAVDVEVAGGASLMLMRRGAIERAVYTCDAKSLQFLLSKLREPLPPPVASEVFTYALACSSAECIAALMDSGKVHNQPGLMGPAALPLPFAVCLGSDEAVRAVADRVPDVAQSQMGGRDPFTQAVAQCRPKVAEMLLGKSKRFSFSGATSPGNSCDATILAHRDPRYMRMALQCPAFKRIMSCGDKRRQTFGWCLMGSPEALRVTFEHGLFEPGFHDAGAPGSATFIAAVTDLPGLLQMVLDIAPNEATRKRICSAALVRASCFGRMGVIRMLLARRPRMDVNARLPGGEPTALHCACANGHAEAVAELCKHGGDATAGSAGDSVAESIVGVMMSGSSFNPTPVFEALQRHGLPRLPPQKDALQAALRSSQAACLRGLVQCGWVDLNMAEGKLSLLMHAATLSPKLFEWMLDQPEVDPTCSALGSTTEILPHLLKTELRPSMLRRYQERLLLGFPQSYWEKRSRQYMRKQSENPSGGSMMARVEQEKFGRGASGAPGISMVESAGAAMLSAVVNGGPFDVGFQGMAELVAPNHVMHACPASALQEATRSPHGEAALRAIVTAASAHDLSIEHGVCGGNALHFAAEFGEPWAVPVLVAVGVRLDALNISGFAALHLAARRGREEVVAALLAAMEARRVPVDIETRGSCQTALALASEEGHESTQRLLLERGAIPSLRTGPLTRCVPSVCLSHKADFDRVVSTRPGCLARSSSSGRECFHYALATANVELLGWLSEAGCLGDEALDREEECALVSCIRQGAARAVSVLRRLSGLPGLSADGGALVFMEASRSGYQPLVRALLRRWFGPALTSSLRGVLLRLRQKDYVPGLTRAAIARVLKEADSE